MWRELPHTLAPASRWGELRMREAIQLGVFLASVRTRECTWVPGRGWEPEYPSDLQQEKLQRQNPQIPRSWRDSGTDVYSWV